jgi:hypothetical protein
MRIKLINNDLNNCTPELVCGEGIKFRSAGNLTDGSQKTYI